MVARIVFSPHVLSRLEKISFFSSKSSKTASITRSVSGETFSCPTTPLILDLIPSACSGRKILLSSASWRNLSMVALPLSTHCSSLSTIWTENPSVALFWAMPEPMFPAPIIATDCTMARGIAFRT